MRDSAPSLADLIKVSSIDAGDPLDSGKANTADVIQETERSFAELVKAMEADAIRAKEAETDKDADDSYRADAATKSRSAPTDKREAASYIVGGDRLQFVLAAYGGTDLLVPDDRSRAR